MPKTYERIYEHTTQTGVTIGLYERSNNTDFPYIIKRNGNLIAEADYLGNANREYHATIRREECPF